MLNLLVLIHRISPELFLHLRNVDMSHSLITIKNSCNLFKRRAFGLNIYEVHKDELHANPQCVEEGEVPVLGEIFPRDRIRLAEQPISIYIAWIR